MLQRCQAFSDLIGNTTVINFIRSKIAANNLPDCIMLIAEEGLGKTTLAKLIALELTKADDKQRDMVLNKDLNTANIITTSESSKALAELKSNVNPSKAKVVILEECHTMDGDKQNEMLRPIEYLNKGTYLIALTTDEISLQKDFKSRFVPFYLRRVSNNDMYYILKGEADRRGLIISDIALKTIVTYSENKPRKGLKMIEAFGDNCQISDELVYAFTDLESVQSMLELLSMYSLPLPEGINYIGNMKVPEEETIVTFFTECFKLKCGGTCTCYSREDVQKMSEGLREVSRESIARALYLLTAKEVSRQSILHMFLKTHREFDSFMNPVRTEKVMKLEDAAATGRTEMKAPKAKGLVDIAELIDKGKQVIK